jgi:Tfp pilus assembly protein PilF
MGLKHHQAGGQYTGGLSVALLMGCFLIAGCAGSLNQTSDQPSALGPPLQEYKLGVAEQKAGNDAAAIEHYQAAVRLDPSLRMANTNLAGLYRSRGDYNLAASQYHIVTRLDPYEESNHYYLGVSEQLLHHFQAAALAYLQALNLQPTDSRAMTNLGVVFLSLGQPGAANAWLKRATIVNPNSAAIWLNYGVSLDAAGRLVDAEAAYRRALELQSSLTPALEDLAANLIAQKKSAEAIATCEQLLLRNDSAFARTRYAQALALSGDDEAAARQFDLAMQRDPHSFIALTGKGFFLIHRYQQSMEIDESQRTQAMALWQQSLSINGNQPAVRNAMEKWKTSHLAGE